MVPLQSGMQGLVPHQLPSMPSMRAMHVQKQSAIPPFWDCRLSKLEIWVLMFVFGCAVLLHLGPILHSALGVPILYLLAITSYLSPASGFLFIACGQFLPFPETSANNPAQIGVLVWLPVTLLRYHRIRLNGISQLWVVLPWLVWFAVLAQENVFWIGGDYMKALFYCVIACQLANEAEGKYLKCLFGLCLGALLVMIAYWAQKVGLPVQINDWGGDREGFTRMGGARADSVLVWPALLFGISGLLGMLIAFASRFAPCPPPKWLKRLVLGLSMASLPALVSTMCHGAFAGLALVCCAFAVAIWMAARNGPANNPKIRELISWCCAGLVGVALMFVFDFLEIRTKTLALDRFHSTQSEELGGATASRTGVWHDSINTIMSYPILGIRVTGDREVITSEYASQGSYLSHNVFLDYGRYCGIPCMIFLGFFFFYPVIKMVGSGSAVTYTPFILAHFAMFIFWMSLSFQFYKTFWALWMLMAVVISPSARSSSQPVRTKRARYGKINQFRR